MRNSRALAETDTQRLEAFSDGIFAIAITLLILEIKVPQVNPSEGTTSLASGLFALWPSYFAYIFSFIMIGVFWANHHYVFNLYERSNRIFKLINLFFLIVNKNKQWRLCHKYDTTLFIRLNPNLKQMRSPGAMSAGQKVWL